MFATLCGVEGITSIFEVPDYVLEGLGRIRGIAFVEVIFFLVKDDPFY
jgi:hypothetical protein